ncbi:MAG: ABC transporter ATP-binding protein [Clostridiales bacterium]|nr:ABC transporter ATP-binding protein [Clostridiales bacterium]
MLKIRNLCAFYGPVRALNGVDIDVESGRMTCLIGSNGAGKSTLFNAISGMIHHTGSVMFGGEEIGHRNSRQIARMGIVQVPEGRHVFPGLTVEENLETGTVAWHGYFGRQPFAKELEMVYELFPRLRERRKQLAWSLSGGEQQMLAIGRGLMARPKLLMLDEPSMGLAPVLVTEMFEKIVEINRLGLTVFLNEQNARLAMLISDNTYVIEQGRIKMHGPSAELRKDPRIAEAYLGKAGGGKG